MARPPSPETIKRRQRDNLRLLHARIVSAFSFHQIKDWHDLQRHLGIPDTEITKTANRPLTFPELKEFLKKQVDELETKLQSEIVQTAIDTTYEKPKSDRQNVVELPARTEEAQRPIGSGTESQSENGKSQTTVESAPLRVGDTNRTIQSTPIQEAPKIILKAEDNYGYTRSPNVSVALYEYWFQKKAAAEAIRKIVDEGKTGLLILAPTGTGKTFIVAMIERHLRDIGWSDSRTWSHIKSLYVTKATILTQTHRVFGGLFNLKPNVDTEITNIEQLRSAAGEYWLREKLVVQNGKEIMDLQWKNGLQPVPLYLDESQGAKNKKSKQSRIIYKYNELPLGKSCLVCISATPFARVSEAQAFAVATHRPLEHLGFPKGSILTNDNWNAYASMISSPSKPTDFNKAAVDRLIDDLEPWIVRVKGVKPQFDAINGVKIIQFESDAKRKFYEDAWERFLKEKAKIDAAKEAGDNAGICYLVVLLKFAMAAEFCHAEHFAHDMHEAVTKRGKAAVAAVKFKATLIEIQKLLIEKYGVSRDNISLIWGGGQTQLTEKQKSKAKIKALSDKLKAMGLEADEMIGDMGLDDVEDRVLVQYPEEWRLGPQDQITRQNEIDKFQRGESLYCIYTLKAGGVGLSLHHTDELTSFKCRRKESGYAFEEDIAKVPVRPRETFIVVTYNAIELVQGVGRVPRLTSLSPTVQNVYCYAGTIEVRMGQVYSQKLRCLSAVVRQRESWQQIIFGGGRDEEVKRVLDLTKDAMNDESSLIDEGDTDEEGESENGNGKETND